MNRFLNIYFVALPDPIGINRNITLHFVYDERRTPYLATPTINEQVDDLLLRVGGPQDVTISFTHLPAAPADYQVRTTAAVRVMEHFKGDVSALAPVTASEFVRDDEEFKPKRLVTIAEVAVYDGASTDTAPVDTELEDLTDPWLRGLHCLQHFVHSYNLSADVPARVPTYMRVGPSIPLLRRELTIEKPDWTIHLLPLNHKNFGGDRPTKLLETNALAQVLSNVQLLSAGDIRAIYRRAVVEAEQTLTVDGDFANAIVMAAQACEILLDGVLGLMLWEETGGAPESTGDVDAAAAVLATPLASRVKKEYHPRLGGQWNPLGASPVGEWSRKVAGPRNRVVHRGFRPTADEAADALNAMRGLDDYVTELLAAQARKSPRTALMWVGEDRLASLGRWPLVKAFARKRQKTEPPWRDKYAAWRQRVDSDIATGRVRAR